MIEIHGIDKGHEIEIEINGETEDIGYLLNKIIDEIFQANASETIAAMAMVILDHGVDDAFVNFLEVMKNGKQKN